jgi:hypothetical protein
MTSQAREAFDRVLPEVVPDARAELFNLDFLWTPVSVREFCDDPYYLGNILHNGLYPQLLDDLEELFSGSYTEVYDFGSVLTRNGLPRKRFAIFRRVILRMRSV